MVGRDCALPAPNLRKRRSVLSFPYVCPEPVSVKRCILYINGAKSGVSLPRSHSARRSPCILRKTHHLSFLSASLCLSRACLGKATIVFSIKWHYCKNGCVFRTSEAVGAAVRAGRHARCHVVPAQPIKLSTNAAVPPDKTINAMPVVMSYGVPS